MSESTQSCPGMSRYRDDAILYPEIRSYRDESSDLYPEISDSVIESADLFEGMDIRLFIAAEGGNVDDLNKLIEGPDKLNILQQFTRLGTSGLHIAVSGAHLPFIERLLQEVKRDSVAGRQFVRARNSDGNSALHLAAFYGHTQLVEELIELGKMEGDVEEGNFMRFQNREGNTALHEAAKERGNYKVVDVLLNHDADLASISNAAGETALFIASEIGHEDIVERLLSCGGDHGNMKRWDWQTPLHSAVFYTHRGVVKKLLEHKPDLAKQKDRYGRTAMHMLALSHVPTYSYRRYRNIALIAGMLFQNDNSLCYKVNNRIQTPLHMAVERERYHLVDILLILGKGCVEAVDKEGRKPLHLALASTENLIRTTECINFLHFKFMLLSLVTQKSLNHRDNRGRTPLHIAVENFEKDTALYGTIIDMLCRMGALRTLEIREEYMRKVGKSAPKVWIKPEKISINAVLIATVSFAAAFALPGGLDSEHQAVFINTALFNLFLICDTFSFCTSIACAILVQFAEQNEQQDQVQVVFSIRLLWSALMSLVVAFGAGVHLVIVPSPWQTGIMWTMVSLVPIAVTVASLRSKAFLCDPEMWKFRTVLSYQYLTIEWMLWFLFDIINLFFFSIPLNTCVRILKKCQRNQLKILIRAR